jgi:hypothetical protein
VTPEFLDLLFESVYRRDLAFQDRADLRAIWQSVRNQVAIALGVVGLSSISPFSMRNQLRRLEKTIEQEVLPLRRDVAPHHRERNLPPSSP